MNLHDKIKSLGLVKGIDVIYTENVVENGALVNKEWEARLEGVQGDGSAIIYIEGNPYRVPALRLRRKHQ